jgi:hypothetical protein
VRGCLARRPAAPVFHGRGSAGAGAPHGRGQELLAGLGFEIERLDNLTLLLRGGERRAALAILLDPAEIRKRALRVVSANNELAT